MSWMVFNRYQLKPGADRGEFGTRALEFCRWQRSLTGRLSSRYFWDDPNSIVILTEVNSAADIYGDGGFTKEGAKVQFALADVSDRTDNGIWVGASAGTEINELAQS